MPAPGAPPSLPSRHRCGSASAGRRSNRFPAARSLRPPVAARAASDLIAIGSVVAPCAAVRRVAQRAGQGPRRQAGLHPIWGFAPVAGAERPVSGTRLHPVRGFAPVAVAESAGTGPGAPVPGANPHAGCTIAPRRRPRAPVPGADPLQRRRSRAPVPGADPRAGCTIAPRRRLSSPRPGCKPPQRMRGRSTGVPSSPRGGCAPTQPVPSRPTEGNRPKRYRLSRDEPLSDPLLRRFARCRFTVG